LIFNWLTGSVSQKW